MEKILFLAHTETNGTLSKVSLEALHAASELAQGESELTVGLVGEVVQAAADQLAACGAVRFLAAVGAEFGMSRYASDAAAAVALAKAAGATVVVAAGTPRFCRALPGATQRLDGRIDTGISRITGADGPIQVERWYYRQRLEAVLTRTQRPWFMLVAGSAFLPWEGEAGRAAVEEVEVEAAAWRTEVIGIETPSAHSQTIRPEAELLFVAGAGWTKKQADGQTHVREAESTILAFLQKSRASLGSSKSLVDQGSEGQVLSFLSHFNQVGQTGTTPRHPKGLAACCHGEEPHVVGWRFVNERRAVNLDANCGWARGKADVLYVADAFAVMKKVNELLDSQAG